VNRRADDFVSRASHELRTPLTSIIGYTDVLLDDSAGFSEDQVKQLEAIERHAAIRAHRHQAHSRKNLSRVTVSGSGVSVGLLVKGAARGTSFCFLC